MNLYLEHIEGKHGRRYVTLTLAIITASNYGMTEDELMDILSCNEEVCHVMKWVEMELGVLCEEGVSYE